MFLKIIYGLKWESLVNYELWLSPGRKTPFLKQLFYKDKKVRPKSTRYLKIFLFGPGSKKLARPGQKIFFLARGYLLPTMVDTQWNKDSFFSFASQKNTETGEWTFFNFSICRKSSHIIQTLRKYWELRIKKTDSSASKIFRQFKKHFWPKNKIKICIVH